LTAAPQLGTPSLAQAHILTAANINTAPPVVDAASAQITRVLEADDITAGQPQVEAAQIVQIHALNSIGITTGSPVVPPSQCVVVFNLLADGILTGQPIVGSLAIDASRKRSVHVSDPSNNVAVVTIGANACILSENTPNAAVVSEANEAA
jgi:hypothetical protein